MDYFKILNLHKEPFSNSPDPEFFFESRQHKECLQKIELSLRLRRGLSVIIGDVGTGKTTLCRQLIQRLAVDDKVEAHLILDPSFNSTSEFLSAVARAIEEQRPRNPTRDQELKEVIKKYLSDWQLKEIIKKYLFHRGVDEGKTVVLIIDEGQKLPAFCLEVLREFLNYETNAHKLLQIVIFAQKEFVQTLEGHKNVSDRVDLFHVLRPLSFQETRSMIRYRLARASDVNAQPSLFSYPALWALQRATQGYPRKIIHLCHRIILTMIIQNRPRAGWSLARFCARRVFPEQEKRRRRKKALAFAALSAAAILFVLTPRALKTPASPEQEVQFDASQATTRENALNPYGETKSSLKVGPGETRSVALVGMAEASTESASGPNSKEACFEGTKPPELLGQIIAHENDTLWEMALRIYGDVSRRCLNAVEKANPQIKNPRRIRKGQPIRFPAIPVKLGLEASNLWWVQLRREKRLEAAYRFLNSPPAGAPSMRIIPCWNGQEGLTFLLLNRQPFTDAGSARESLKSLPPGLAREAQILRGWNADTVLFANPIS